MTYVWTHDSIGLGGDGPTHQPVEHLAALRAIPGLDVVRPGDANETAACWQAILEHTDRPAGAGAEPTERPGVPARRGGVLGHQQRAPRRLRAAGHRGRPRRRARRHRLRARAGRRGARAARRGRHRRPGRVDAVPGVVRRSRSRPTATPSSRRSWRPGSRSRPAWRRAGARWSATAAGSSRSRPTAPPRRYQRIYEEYGITATAVADAARDSIAATPTEGSSTMSDRLQALSDAGVSIWLDDLSRERIETGNLAELVKDRNVVGVTTNPTIFAGGHRRRRALRRPGAQARRGRRRRHQGGLRADHRGRPQRVRRPGAGRGVDRGRRPGLHRGRARPGQRHRRAPSHSARALWSAVGRPNVLIKIPATKEGLPAIATAISEGISVNVTLIFGIEPLPRGHGRLPHRPRGRARRRPRPLADPVGRVVLRVPGRHRGRQAARGDRQPTRRSPCAARPRWPTPGWRTPPSRRSSTPTAGAGCSRRVPTRSVRCGRPPASRTPTTPTPSTSPTWSSPTPSTRCRRRRWRRSPTTASWTATR